VEGANIAGRDEAPCVSATVCSTGLLNWIRLTGRRHCCLSSRCPLYPQKRTLPDDTWMSACSSANCTFSSSPIVSCTILTCCPNRAMGELHESGWVKKRRERKRLAAEFCTIF
jgi:hypothetical protein